MATEAVVTHPAGMHSCLYLFQLLKGESDCFQMTKYDPHCLFQTKFVSPLFDELQPF